MGLLAIIAGTEPQPDGVSGLNPHGIASVLGEFLRGRYTSAELIEKMGLPPGALRDEITAWAQPFNGLAPEADVHGSLYVANASTTQALSANTWTKVTQFTQTGEASGCAPSAANDEIVVTSPGVYRVSYSCTFTGPATAQVGFRAAFGGVAQNQTLSSSAALSLGEATFLAASGFVDVTSKDATPFILQALATVGGNLGIVNAQLVVERVRPAAGRSDPGGSPVNRQKIHDVLNGLEQGIYSIAEAEAELDYQTTA